MALALYRDKIWKIRITALPLSYRAVEGGPGRIRTGDKCNLPGIRGEKGTVTAARGSETFLDSWYKRCSLTGIRRDREGWVERWL